MRNIVQSVLGGGGIGRSPLLHWNDYVSWVRLSDSLLFTGFSVPLLDYADTLSPLFDTYGRLEALLPELNVWETLEVIGEERIGPNPDAKDLEKLIVIGALDLLYFWMYQPRAQTALRYLIKTLSDEEKQIFIGCQSILRRQREISQMFIDGVVGINFSKGLSFYLQYAPGYLKAMDRLFGEGIRPAGKSS